MKSYQQFKENALQNPIGDIQKYITGLKNRLILIRPEEVDLIKDQLADLRHILDEVLRDHP
jgi:hypothetical protein